MQIILTHDGNLTAQEQEDLRYLFTDALHEFCIPRVKPDYIDRRYESQGQQFKTMKRDEVNRRVCLALKLHNATFNIDFKEN